MAFVRTVLGSNVTRASDGLVPRLISGGVNIRERQWIWSFYGREEAESTALHVAWKWQCRGNLGATR